MAGMAQSLVRVAPHVRLARFGGDSDDTALCRTLMREYAAHLNASVRGEHRAPDDRASGASGPEHICIETLEAELAALPGPYAEPDGAVLLAWAGDEPAGCVALKPVHLGADAEAGAATQRVCEMKRLWVRRAHQGLGIGRLLAESVVTLARERGYAAMVLDTMPRTMPAAYALYCAVGFVPIERYNDNPTLRRIDAQEIAWLRKEL